MKRFFILAALFPAFSAEAFVSSAGPVATRSGNAIQISYPISGSAIASSARTISAGATSGEAKILDMFTATGPAGPLPVSISRTVTAGSIAAGLARVAAKSIVPISVGMALYDLYKGAGIQTGSNGLEIDSGAESQSVDDLTYQVSNGPIAGSMGQACSGYAATFNSVTSGYRDGKLSWEPYKIDSAVSAQGAGYLCAVYLIDPFTGTSNRYRNEPVVTYKTKKQVCGNGVVRLDGMCETGVYSPATESQILPALERLMQKLDSATTLKRLIGAGGYADPASTSISGPATQVGASQTTNTTGPSGSVSSTVTPTYNYTYAGDTITYNTVNNTVTNKTDISGKTTTETESKPDNTQNKELCDLFPSALACIKPGEAPSPEDLPIVKKDANFSPDARWGAGAGSCSRGPVQLSFGSFDLWKPFCDWASMIRGVVIAGFSLAAAAVFLSGVRAQ